ncbi:hypothetical protein [Deinococcus hohokamensis]|uniref:Uncharacterized protein n=1 Tax=Deinococcus hohokamensis TaxID=309883 RepID=A0ABV9I8T3_9DEIO
MSLPLPKAPWRVGRPARLEEAAHEYLGELTRQQPWRRARAEALLDDLDEFLGGAASLGALCPDRLAAWQASLPEPDQEEAATLTRDFLTYLRQWHWLD